MKKNNYLTLILPCLIFAGIFILQPNTVAQVTLYTGPNNGNWSDPLNWSDGLPGDTDNASIDGNSGSPSIVDTDFNVGAILFSGSNNKVVTIAADRTLRLSGYTVGSDVYFIRHLGNASLTINSPGKLSLGATGQIFIQNARTVNLNSIIEESGGSRGIIKTGVGTLNLLANNASSNYSGGFEIRDGTVLTNVSSTGSANNPTSGPFGTGTLRFAGGSFEYTSSSNGNIHNSIEVTADTALGGTGANRRMLVFHGDVDLTGDARAFNTNQFDSTANAERSTQFAGVISNGGFIKRGESSINLTAINTYTGNTVIEQGTLRLNAGGSIAQSGVIEIHEEGVFTTTNAYELTDGQILTGNGLVDSRLRIGQGTINPGLNGIGVLKVDADVTFGSAGSMINFEADELGMDQLVFTSEATRTLSGNNAGAVEINIIDLGGFQGGEFVLISTSGLIDPVLQNWGLDTFSLGDTPEGWVGSLRMEGNDLVVTLQIPESRTIVGILSVTVLALLFHRTRKFGVKF